MSKPRLLDLFCGAGGASMGYHRAGFDVVGVDIKPQKNYPFEFHQWDALCIRKDRIDGCIHLVKPGRIENVCLGHFDAIHASPPCQAFTAMRVMANARPHRDLLRPTRDELMTIGLPFIIENVEQAPMEIHPPMLFTPLSGVRLCGSMFALRTEKYELRRHRLFESNVPLPQLQCQHDSERTVVGFYGDHARTRTRINGHHARGTDITRGEDKLALVRDLMGIDWMNWSEANQAIPPAYTLWIGKQLLKVVEAS